MNPAASPIVESHLQRSDAAAGLHWRILAGFEAGVIGAIVLLAFLSLDAMWHRHQWWSFENLAGSVVYGPSALRRGLGRATIAGAALELVSGGIAGCLFGIAFARTRGRALALVSGVSFGVVWFYLTHQLLFSWIGPLVPMYASQPATLISHMLLGLVLSRTPVLYWSRVAHLPIPVQGSLPPSGGDIASQDRLE
jgi:hypothetical protein